MQLAHYRTHELAHNEIHGILVDNFVQGFTHLEHRLGSHTEISGAESEGSLISASCCLGSSSVLFSPTLQLDTGTLFSHGILPSDIDLFIFDLMKQGASTTKLVIGTEQF
jgi:hypothetical protein